MTVQQKIDDGAVPYRFSRSDFILLSESGAFDRLAKAELIEGVIVGVNAQYSRHARVQTLLFRALARACDALAADTDAWLDASIAIDDGNMPRPDIFVAKGLPADGPVPADRLLLVIEVADTSLHYDLGDKARLYAAAGIAEYWVADAVGAVLYQMWSPSDGAYTEQRQIAFGATIEAITADGISFELPRL